MTELTGWVPPSILVAVSAILVRYQIIELIRRLIMIELGQKAIMERLPGLATHEQLSNMGDRLHARISELSEHTDERVADLRERVKVLESRQ